MSYGISYTYEGYLSRLSKDRLDDEYDNQQKEIDLVFREILAYMVATPPPFAKYNVEGGGEYPYPYPEFLAMKIKEYRERLEEAIAMQVRISECREAMREHPDQVVEG